MPGKNSSSPGPGILIGCGNHPSHEIRSSDGNPFPLSIMRQKTERSRWSRRSYLAMPEFDLRPNRHGARNRPGNCHSRRRSVGRQRTRQRVNFMSGTAAHNTLRNPRRTAWLIAAVPVGLAVTAILIAFIQPSRPSSTGPSNDDGQSSDNQSNPKVEAPAPDAAKNRAFGRQVEQTRSGRGSRSGHPEAGRRRPPAT